MATATTPEIPELVQFLENVCEHTSAAALYAEDAGVNLPEAPMTRADALAVLGRSALARRNAQLTLEELGKLEEDVLRRMAS